MLAIVAGCQDCSLALTVDNSAITVVPAASQSTTLPSIPVNVSEMHFNALRSLTQPCLTAYCI